LELSLWNVRFGTFALELAFNNFHLEATWKFHSDDKKRLGSFFRLGAFVWDLSFRLLGLGLGTSALDLWLEIFVLGSWA
jgi:hypothetical protein